MWPFDPKPRKYTAVVSTRHDASMSGDVPKKSMPIPAFLLLLASFVALAISLFAFAVTFFRF